MKLTNKHKIFEPIVCEIVKKYFVTFEVSKKEFKKLKQGAEYEAPKERKEK